MLKTFVVCLFSFNRAEFLRNCILSIEKCAPQCKLVVFDDNSADVQTLEVLAQCRERHEVVQPENSDSDSKFGGLYNNMQMALDRFGDEPMLLFIQDDMQMLRPLQESDFRDCNRFFDKNPKAAFIHPAFLRGGKRERDITTTRYDGNLGVYYRESGKQSAGVHFSAIIIVKPERLRVANWRLAQREKVNDQSAREAFGKMGFLLNPFCAWLPNVPVYRGKVKTLALRIAERQSSSGFFPYKILSNEATQKLMNRDPEQLPVAEDFLELEAGEVLPKPWIYYALEGRPLLKILNRIELKLRKLLR